MTSESANDFSSDLLVNLITEAEGLLAAKTLTSASYATWRAHAEDVLTKRFGANATITRRVGATGTLPTRFHEASMAEVVTRLDAERRERLQAMKTAIEALLKEPSVSASKP